MSNLRVPSLIALTTSTLLFVALPALARAQAGCGPLLAPTGVVIDVTPSQVGSLQLIIDTAQPGDTIQLSDGLYSLPRTLVFRTPGLTLRSKSRNRNGVTLDGRYAIGDVLLLQGASERRQTEQSHRNHSRGNRCRYGLARFHAQIRICGSENKR